jgi:hypothetical protein
MDKEQIESELTGNTLRVYWFLLRTSNGVVGPRAAQRALNFSSPALAVYHLDKLVELGLLEKTDGEYRLVKTVSVGVLKQFVRLGAFMLPRHLLYATMFTSLLIFYLTQFRRADFYSLFALTLGLLATGITWYETLKAWKQRP